MGKGRSRQQDKMFSHKFGQLSRIYTKRSLDVHLSRAKSFYNWVKANHIKVHKLSELTPKLATKYLMYEQQNGRSPWTVSSDMLMFNHAEVGSGNWNQSITKKNIKENYGYKLERRSAKLITHSRGYNAKSWINSHKNEYYKYKDEIDVARAFGLRRDEIIGNQGGHNGVIDKSFINNKGKMRVQTIGKGGKYRVADCLNKYNDEMLNKYGQNAVSEPYGRTGFKKLLSTDKPIFNVRCRDVAFHSLRSEYAINKFEELNTGRDDEQLDINGYKGDKSAFEQVSKNLGHNRLDVLKSYFR